MKRVIVLALVAVCIVLIAFKGDKPVAAVPHVCFDPYNDSSVADLAFFDTIVPRYRVFLVGEVHGVAVNPRLNLKMIKYLYAHANMRHLVIEYGPAEAFLFERYLETGDEYWVEDSWMYKMPEYVRFWHELYAFNKSVEEKISVTGLDFDSDHLFAKALAALEPGNVKPAAAIQPMIDSIAALKNRETSFTGRTFIDAFRADFELNEKLYDDYFGVNYEKVYSFVRNEASFQEFRQRDVQMYLNFVAAQPDSSKSYFGMFGGSHVYIATPGSFAMKVNESPDYPEFRGKVMSVWMCYDSCRYFYRNQSHLLEPSAAIAYLKKKQAERAVATFREQAQPCSSAFFDLRIVNDPLIEEIASETPFLFYVRKSGEVGFKK